MKHTLIKSSIYTVSLLFVAGTASADQIHTKVVLSPGALDTARLSMPGFSQRIHPGQPALPLKVVSVAIHPRADLSTLSLSLKPAPVDTVSGSFRLQPNPPARLVRRGVAGRELWGKAAARIRDRRDRAAFGDQVFPPQALSLMRVDNRRELPVARLSYSPVRYRHATGELLLDRHTEATLTYSLKPGPDPRPDPVLAPHLDAMYNAAQAKAWFASPAFAAPTSVGYAIVIPDKLAKASTQLAKFVKHKQSLGFSVYTVGDSLLSSIKVGKNEGDAQRIRGWLQKNYKALDLQYVLLIGNPDPSRRGAPMVLTYPMADYYQGAIYTPSDYYFGELTGDWDMDNDGKVAEWVDDQKTGGVEWTPELYVGRIPVYDDNVAALDKILQKTIAYTTDTSSDRSWRGRVLQPAAMLFYKNQYGQNQVRIDGADLAETIYRQVIKPAGFSHTTLYETAGVDPSTFKGDLSLTRDNLVKEWRKGYGLVSWYGHGSPTGAYRTVWVKDNGDKIPYWGEVSSPAFFTFDDVLKLDDARPSFVFHGSCSNGYPERPDNIGYGLLMHGAVGTVSSSRDALVVIGSSNAAASIFGVQRDFVRHLLAGKSAGYAVMEGKKIISDALGKVSWYTRLEINLYGDPSLTLAACATDAQCDDGKLCNGKETCKAGQCVKGTSVTCSSTDPCTTSVCSEPSGKCVTAARPEGEACDDNKFCTVGDACRSGTCVGKPRCAAPNNPCVATSCDETLRTCDVTAAAQEGDACRQDTDRQGACASGICRPDPATGCSVGSPRDGGLWMVTLLALFLFIRRRDR